MSAAAAFEAFLQDEDALQERCPVKGKGKGEGSGSGLGGLDGGGVPRRLIDMAGDEVDKCRQETQSNIFSPLNNLSTLQSIINVTWQANQESLASYGVPKQGSYLYRFRLKGFGQVV